MIDVSDRDLLGLVRRVLQGDELLRHGGIVATATIASGALNYAYQLFMGRALGPEQFGVFGALFALFYLINVLGQGIRFSASRFTAELDAQGGRLAAFHRGFLRNSLLAGIGLSVVFGLASPAIAGFLGIASPWPVVVLALTIPFVLALRANLGTLQGLQWFVPLGAYGVAQALIKLIVGVALVLLGYGVLGALGAVTIGMLVGVLLTLRHIRRGLLASPSSVQPIDYRRVYRYAPPAVLAGFCLTVPGNVDVIVVKHFFTSQQAGLYAAAAVLGKILLFVPLGISTALFPKVTNGATESTADRLNELFDRAILYSAVLAGAGALLYWTAAELVLELFFGSAYVAAAPLVRWYGLAILSFVSAVVVLKFSLAQDRLRFVYVFAGMSVLEIALMWLLNGSMVRVIQVIILVNAAVLAYGLLEVKR